MKEKFKFSKNTIMRKVGYTLNH